MIEVILNVNNVIEINDIVSKKEIVVEVMEKVNNGKSGYC